MIAAQRIVLTEDQQFCIDYDESPHFLISGVAGSGKTTVLLRRACRLAQSGDRVVVFTYNKTLATYARELVDLNANGAAIEVTNFHRWAWQHLSPEITRRQPVRDWEREKFIGEVIGEHATSLSPSPALRSKSQGWWSDEFSWIKQRGILDLPEYLKVQGTTRHQGLTKDLHLPIMWGLFHAFCSTLTASGRYEFDDFGRELLRTGEVLRDRVAIDHVLVDELQDLAGADQKLLRMLARKTLTLVEDRGQKLYKRTYHLVQAGIEVAALPVPGRGLVFRSKRLGVSYRSTREIAALAESLRQRDTSLTAEERKYQLPDEPSGYKPIVYGARDIADEEETALRWITTLAGRNLHWTIALVARQKEVLDRLWGRIPPSIPHEFVRDSEGSPSSPGVKLITAHSSKGLEFDAVVLLHVNEGVIPVTSPDPGPNLTDEERADFEERRVANINDQRRLVYVPMSRARSQLYVLYANGLRSRFLDELDSRLYDTAPADL